MTQSLSLLPVAKSNIPPHSHRGKKFTDRIPAPVLRLILTFLPFREFMICQKTCKDLQIDILTWTKQRSVFDADCLFKFFQGKRGLEREGAVAEMAKIGGVMQKIDFTGMQGEELTQLLQANEGILSRVENLSLYKLPEADHLLNRLAPKYFSELRTLRYQYSDFHCRLSKDLPQFAPKLTTIHAVGALAVSAEELSKICPCLTNLDVRDGVQIGELSSFPQLTSLEIGETSKSFCELFKEAPHLRSLYVREVWDGSCLMEEGLNHLAQIPQLQSLTILQRRHSYEPATPLKNLRALERARHFTTLAMIQMELGTKSALLNTLPRNILDLRLERCKLVNEDFAAIARLPKLRSLTVKSESDPEEYTDEGIAHLRGCKATLTALEFSHRPGFQGGGAAFTTQGMIGLVRELSALRTLDLSECRLGSLDTEAIEQGVRLTNPNLALIHKTYWKK